MTAGREGLEIIKIRDKKGLEAGMPADYSARKAAELESARKHKFLFFWNDRGFCEACGKETVFVTDWRHSDGVVPNFRERMMCRSCSLNSRQRFMAGMARKLAAEAGAKGLDLYMHEQVTKFYRFVSKNLHSVRLTGSEYLGPQAKRGQEINGVRNEDACNLTFQASSFDAVISNDVLEHVPEPDKAFSESLRVLKPGGIMLFSVPFYSDREKSSARAGIKNGRVEHLLPPQYHGNPASLKRSLVFWDFGWDMLDSCKKAGFHDAYALAYYSLRHGYPGAGRQMVFAAEKSAGGQK